MPANPKVQPDKEWRPFYSLFSEDWVFESPLRQDELSARLDASWHDPYRVSSGGWDVLYISAVLQPHGWYFVKNRRLYPDIDNPTTQRNLGEKFGQRFTGKVLATETGSRLVGQAGLNSLTTLEFLQLFVLATLLFQFSPVFLLWLATAIFAALCFYPNMFGARTKRLAIWKFLHAATQTPASATLVDDVARLTTKWRESIAATENKETNGGGYSDQANPRQPRKG